MMCRLLSPIKELLIQNILSAKFNYSRASLPPGGGRVTWGLPYIPVQDVPFLRLFIELKQRAWASKKPCQSNSDIYLSLFITNFVIKNSSNSCCALKVLCDQIFKWKLSQH